MDKLHAFGSHPEGYFLGLDRLSCRLWSPQESDLVGASLLDELVQSGEMGRGIRLTQNSQCEQGIVKLVGVSDGGPGFLRDLPDRLRIQGSQIAGSSGEQLSSSLDGPGATLLQGRVVQEGVGVGVQDFVAEG